VWLRSQFATHILEKHSGRPMTSCHKCIKYSTGVSADLEVINIIKSEIKKSK